MPKNKARKIIVAYVPVIHRGYIEFFNSYPDISELYILGPSLIKKTNYLRKDLRALSPDKAAVLLSALKRFNNIKVLEEADLKALDSLEFEIVMPDEDVSREVSNNFKRAGITYYPIFLRWDRSSVEKKERDPEEQISKKKIDQDYMSMAVEASARSSDIWRRVGAVLLTKSSKKPEVSCNVGETSSHSPWMEGDPRNIFNRGVGIEMSLYTHAEALLIANAAKAGRSLKGATMYVTTFPCPACAKLIAHSGIRKLFYKDGYAVLDGKKVLFDYGVKVARVVIDNNKDSDLGKVPYSNFT